MPLLHSSDESVLPDRHSTFMEWERLLEEHKKHMCALPEGPDIVDIYVRHGRFLKLRRWFRRLTLISDRNPNVKLYFKSMAAVKQEMIRHIKSHHYTLHPMSIVSAYWRFFMALNLTAILILIPAIITTRLDFLRPIKLVLDLLFIVDTFVNFNTGYEVYSRKEVVMSKKAIRRRYILGYYFLDLFSSVPIDYCLFLMGKQHICFNIIPSLKLLKLYQFSQTMSFFYLWFGIRKIIRKLSRIIFLHVLIIWWCSCLMAAIVIHADKSKSWYYKVSPNDDKTTTLLSLCFYRAASMCLSVGFGNMGSRVYLDHLVDFICMTLGIGLFVFWMAELLQFLNQAASTSMRYQDLMQQIYEYINFKELPPVMAKRIKAHYEYRYNHKFYREHSILTTVSPRLKQEISFASCRTVLDSVHFFQVLPSSILMKLAVLMKRETFLPNDVVLQAGVKMKAMYFLAAGTAAVYQKNGRELCHLEDRGYFGELCFLVSEELMTPGVVAVSACEFFLLTTRNMLKFREEYPNNFLKIKRILYDRLERSMAFQEMHGIDVTPPYFLIEEYGMLH